jgi:excisionase family DNA binding protein
MTEDGEGEPQRLTISVPEAGRRLGIGRNHAYECARRGELPVIRLGHKLVVPLAALERMLAIQASPPMVTTEGVHKPEAS